MTMPVRREYVSGKPSTLSAGISSVATTITIADGTGYPTGATGNFFVTIAANTAGEERVLCASRAGNIITVAAGGRGADGTTATSHALGDSIWPSFSALDADQANAHTSASASTASVTIHGLANGSSVVGTTDTQTLSNKTLGTNLAAGGFKVTGLGAPSSSGDAATKDYVDTSAGGAGGFVSVFMLGGM